MICTDARVRSVVVIHVPELGHHPLVSAELQLTIEKPPSRWINRLLKDKLIDQFQTDLKKMHLNPTEDMSDVKTMLNTFTKHVIMLFELHAPYKNIKIKEDSYHWITDTVKEMMQLRNRYYCK